MYITPRSDFEGRFIYSTACCVGIQQDVREMLSFDCSESVSLDLDSSGTIFRADYRS